MNSAHSNSNSNSNNQTSNIQQSKSSKSLRNWRIIFGAFQVLLMVAGVAVAILGVGLYAGEPLSESMLPTDAMTAMISGAIMMAICGLIAFIVIPLKKRRIEGAQGVRIRWIVVDSIIMAAIGASMLISGVLLRSPPNAITARLSGFWETASPALLSVIQQRGQCCGFASYSDRVLEPCSKFNPAVGCASVLLDDYRYYTQQILQPALFCVSALCFAGAFLAALFSIVRLRLREREERESQALMFSNALANGEDVGIFPAKLKRSQPFDAWHKAVMI